MIKLRKNLDKGYFDIIIDGNFYEKVYAQGPEYFDYHSENKEASQKLANHKLIDFSPFEFIWLENIFSWLDFEHMVFISQEFESREESYDLNPAPTNNIEISFTFEPYLLNWKKKFSFREYADKFKNTWKTKEQFGEYNFYEGEGADQFSITINVSKFDSTIAEFISPYENYLKIIHSEVSRNLLSEKESLITAFSFPKEIETACKQYLLYFVTFLQDLGIKIDSDIKTEAGKVLFSVTPTDDIEALDKIREALAVYLNLPSSPIADIEFSENFALMRLQQQVRNLQHSQQMAKTEILSAQYALSLAQQNIDNQDRIIVRQNSLIENQDKIIKKITSDSVIIDSIEKKEEKEEFEEIYEGLRVGESKWLRELTGIGLSSAKFIKAAVKNTLGKENENISILDSGEEKEKNN